MPHGRDALAARFTRAWSANADAPAIAIYLKPWRERSRTCRTTFSCSRTVFFISAARNDLQRVVRQWPLQRICFIPRRAHPDVTFFFGRENHRHGLGVNRLNDCVRCGVRKP